jgi:hypothetical protein
MAKKVQFQWPQGTQAQLKVYPANHPQRKPTEEYFAGVVRDNIRQARSGDYVNLWLMIESLKDLSDPHPQHSGFHSFFWAIQSVLGDDSCRKIGEQVCKDENFTLEEAERHMEDYRRQEAVKYGLAETASWDEVREARQKAHEQEMHR